MSTPPPPSPLPPPSRKLPSARHELYAAALARGETPAGAARFAGYADAASARTCARLEADPTIAARVAWLRSRLPAEYPCPSAGIESVSPAVPPAARAESTPPALTIPGPVSAAPFAAPAGDLLDVDEKRRILAEIARCAAKESDRISAIKADNDLAGEGSEALAHDARCDAIQVLRALTHGESPALPPLPQA